MYYLILICGIVFWTLYYFFEGSHDGVFANEVKLLKSKIDSEEYKLIEKSFIKYELSWHWYDALEKGLVKIVIAILIYFLTADLLFSIQMFALSIGIRSIAHDYFVARKMGKGINHIGPDFLIWDRLLRRLSQFGINQYVIKLLPNIILIFWILWYIN